MFQELIALALLGSEGNVRQAAQAVARRDYVAAQQHLNFVKPDSLKGKAYYKYLYCKLVVSHFDSRKAEALLYAKRIEDEWDAPVRYKVVSALIKWDYKNSKSNPLGELRDIERMMGSLTGRLENRYIGKETQSKQKAVVTALDKLIKKLENAEEKKKADANAKAAAARIKKEQKQSPSDKSADPAKESEIALNGGAGKIDRKKFKELAANWGNLSPRDRDANMRELIKDMPARYKDVIQDYFRKGNMTPERIDKAP